MASPCRGVTFEAWLWRQSPVVTRRNLKQQGKVAHGGKVPSANTDSLSSISGHTWWMERTTSCLLTSTCMLWHAMPPLLPKITNCGVFVVVVVVVGWLVCLLKANICRQGDLATRPDTSFISGTPCKGGSRDLTAQS